MREKISIITQNANKRKNEEQKLEIEKNLIIEKEKQIEELNKKLSVKKQKLKEKKEELQKHKKFNEFLESVVNDKNGDDNKEFNDI